MPAAAARRAASRSSKDLDAVRAAAARRCWARRLVTHQTGPEGLPVHQVYVEVGSKIAREIYLSLVLNRDAGRLAFVASAAGGMDIEEVAEHTPEKIIRVNVHPDGGPAGFSVPPIGVRIGLEGSADRAVRENRARDLQIVLGARCQPGGSQSA